MNLCSKVSKSQICDLNLHITAIAYIYPCLLLKSKTNRYREKGVFMAKTKYEYKQVKVNLTLDDHAKLSVIANDKNMTLAQLLRESVGAKIEDERVPVEKLPPKIEMKIDSKWRYEINKIGVNLNQAVEAMHREGAVIELKALSHIIDSIDSLDDKVTSGLKAKK